MLASRLQASYRTHNVDRRFIHFVVLYSPELSVKKPWNDFWYTLCLKLCIHFLSLEKWPKVCILTGVGWQSLHFTAAIHMYLVNKFPTERREKKAKTDGDKGGGAKKEAVKVTRRKSSPKVSSEIRSCICPRNTLSLGREQISF